MLSLLKLVEMPWEKARGYLRLDLQHIETAVNRRWAVTFGNNNILNPAAIAAGSIDLTTKVTGILPITNGGTGTGTAFTKGSVVFTGVGGIYTQDNANLFWDATNHRLGIGTVIPSTPLHVQSASGLQQTLTQTGTGNVGIEFIRSGGTALDWIFYGKPGTTSLALFSGSDKFTFDTGGNLTLTTLSIGTTFAVTGNIRIPNNSIGFAARNFLNTGDVGMITVNASDQLLVGFLNVTDIVFQPANVEQARIVVGAGVRSIAAGAFYWNGRSVLLSPGDALLTLTNNAQSSGFGLQMGTADTMIVANKAQNAYGSVDALQYKLSATIFVNSSGKIVNYNGVATTGWGVPAIYGYARPAAGQTGAITVATYTVGAADGSFLVSANVNVTVSTLHNFNVTCTYTDETNTSRILILSFSQITGAIVSAITNATGAGAYEGLVMRIRCKASTSITIATTGVFTTVTYNAEGDSTQVA